MRIIVIFFLFLFNTHFVYASSLVYEIYDLTKGKGAILVASGIKKYSVKDIELLHPLMTWKKQVKLEKGFSIGSNLTREKDIDGFVIWIKKDNKAREKNRKGKEKITSSIKERIRFKEYKRRDKINKEIKR